MAAILMQLVLTTVLITQGMPADVDDDAKNEEEQLYLGILYFTCILYILGVLFNMLFLQLPNKTKIKMVRKLQ